jgi:protein-tyrosine-phosphatase
MSDIEREKGLTGLEFPDRALEALAQELSESYRGVFSPETVGRYVLESYAALLRTSRVKAYLVTLTGRFVRERLTALAQTVGQAPKDVPEVLFVCVENAGRSQMAMALMTHLSEGRVHVRSAGSMPAAAINALAVQVMQEIDLDITAEFPKPLTDDVVRAADVVITMGCGDACPVYPGKMYLDWDLADPSTLSVEGVREVRDEIARLVRNLIEEIAPQP